MTSIDIEKRDRPENINSPDSGFPIDKIQSRDDDRLSDTTQSKQDLLGREDVDPVLNAKMHLVNNVSFISVQGSIAY
jgi:hypothetical protein